jgi:8-oxo-dGTP diphosphatase
VSKQSIPRVGSAVIVVDGDRVLMGRRDKDPQRGKWVLPGGGVRPFESVEDAAKRELLEETGLQIEVDRQAGVFEIIDPPEHRVIVYSWGRPVGGELRASTDLSEIRFVERRTLASLDLTPFVREVLERMGMLEERPQVASGLGAA